MAMSIAERMALQARKMQAANKIKPASRPAPANGPKPAMSIQDRIARSVAAKSREGGISTKGISGASNEAIIAKYREEYNKFLAQLETMDFGAMMFNPAAPAEKKEVPAEVAENANGISTAEGEVVVEAVPAEAEGRLNEVPVTVPEEKQSRPKRSRKAKSEKTEESVETEA